MATKRFKKKQIVPRIVNSVTGTYVDNSDPENPIVIIPPGSGDKSETFQQTTPSNYWICPHSLNKVVAVIVLNISGVPEEGEIVKNDGLVVEIKFIDPIAGTAHFN